MTNDKNKKLIMIAIGAVAVFVSINVFAQLNATKEEAAKAFLSEPVDVGATFPIELGTVSSDIVKEDMFSSILQVGNNIVTMPCTVNEMLNAGTTVERIDDYFDGDATAIKANYIIDSNGEELLRFETVVGGSVFYATAVNYSGNSDTLGNCIITGIKLPIGSNSAKEDFGLYLSGGITIGSDVQDVVATYGSEYLTGVENEDVDDDDTDNYITYKYVFSGDIENDYICPAYYISINRKTNKVAGFAAFFQGLTESVDSIDIYDTKTSFTEDYYSKMGYTFETASGLCNTLNPLDSRKTIVTIDGNKYYLSMLTSEFDENTIYDDEDWNESLKKGKSKKLSLAYCDSDYSNAYTFMEDFEFYDMYSENLNKPGYALTEEEYVNWSDNRYTLGTITCLQNDDVNRNFILNIDLDTAYISQVGCAKYTGRSYAVSYLIKPMDANVGITEAAIEYVNSLSRRFAKTLTRT